MREHRVPEIEAYDWLNNLGKYEIDTSYLGPTGLSQVVRHYTDSKTNERVFILDWCVCAVPSKQDAINFAQVDRTKHYWGLRKKHRNDEDGMPVIGWR